MNHTTKANLDVDVIGNCTFEALLDRLGESRLGENMLDHRNHLGLLSEDLAPHGELSWWD